MKFLLLLSATVATTQALFGAGKEQSVAVKGRLMCNGEAAVGVQVMLYDEDVLFDAKLGEMRTNLTGHFEMSGTGREITKIDPYLIIYHDCENTKLAGRRQLQIWLPDKYVSEGKVALKTYDFYQMELAGVFKEYCPPCPTCPTQNLCLNGPQKSDRNL